MVLPHQFAVLLAAVLELACEFEGFAAFDSLAMRQIVHELALINDITFFVGALTVCRIVLELALVAVPVSADVTPNSIDFVVNSRCLKKRLILEYEHAFSVDTAFFPLAFVEDSVVKVEHLIEISAGGQIGA